MKYDQAEMEWDADSPKWDETKRLNLHYRIEKDFPEYIPPANRPELYDPGAAGEVIIDKAIDEAGSEIALSDDQLREAEGWIRDNHEFEAYEPDYER